MNYESNVKTAKWPYWWAAVYVICSYLFLFIPGMVTALYEQMSFIPGAAQVCQAIGSAAYFLPFLFPLVNWLVVRMNREKISREVFLNCVVLIKYSLIPLYLAGGLLVMFFLFMTLIPVPFMILMGPAGAITLSIYGWMILLGSAPFSVAYLNRCRQEGICGSGTVTAVKVMQFFPVLDVVSVMVLSYRENRWRRLTVTVIILVALLFLAAAVSVGVLVVKAFS